MTSYKPVSGKKSAVKYGSGSNGVSLPFSAYHWDANAPLLDMSNANCDGYAQFESGLKLITITLYGVWNAARNPFAVAPTFKLGQRLNNLFVVAYGTVAAGAAAAVVSRFQVLSDAPGLCEYIISLTGTWTFEDFSGTKA